MERSQDHKKVKITSSTSSRTAILNSSGRKQFFFCPFEAVTTFMRIRGCYEVDEEQFFVFSDGTPVRPHHVRSLLRQLLDDRNLDGQLYDVHSFRIGRTCDLYKYGYSIDKIKEWGRWKSNAVYKYLRY